MDYASLRIAYRDAKPRFISDTVEESGVSYARLSDPALGLVMRMDADHATLLPMMFRQRWIQMAREHA
jgi:hypothetical protein